MEIPSEPPVAGLSDSSRIGIDRMFDRIAPRYDLLNRILSFGTDVLWRRRLAGLLNSSTAFATKGRRNLKILDVATGTGDLLLSLFSAGVDISSSIGIDISAKMLAIAEKKIRFRNAAGGITLKQANACKVPFADNSFDVVTIAFGIRNVADAAAGLKEMHRVLKPDGKVLILEFSIPQNRLIRSFYLLYLRNIVPLVGRILSGDGYAYRYLGRTIEAFPSGDDFCAIVRTAGFVNVKPIPMTFGVATIYKGEKASVSEVDKA